MRNILILFFGFSFLPAQMSPGYKIEMAWHPNANQVVISERDSFQVLGRFKKNDYNVKCPPGTIDHRFVGGYFWVVQEDSARRRCLVSRSEDGRVWEMVARWTYADDGGSMGRLYVYPFADEKFLLIERKKLGFKIGKSYYPAVIAKANEGLDLSVEKPFPLGLKESLVVPGELPSDQWRFNHRYIWALSLRLSPIFLTIPDGLVLFFDRVGALMVYDAKGNYRKTVWLHNGLDEERASDVDSYDWAAMCAQPTVYGNILIASRTSDAVLRGRTLFPRKYDKLTTMGSGLRNTNDLDQKALELDPRIEWWSFDPSECVVSMASPPDGVSRKLKSVDQFTRFVFRFDPYGNLVFPYWNVGAKPAFDQ